MAVAKEIAELLPLTPSYRRAAHCVRTPVVGKIELTQADKEAFRRDGFLVVENLTTPAEIAVLRAAYDRLFSERRGWETGDLFDMVGRDAADSELALPQLLWPSRYEPFLRQTQLFASAQSIARQLLGENAQNILEHAIMKPALRGSATPWHQDDAFSRKGSGFVEALSIWMPLQDVSPGSGCMQYVPGSNRGPLYRHRSPNDDPRIHGLEVETVHGLEHSVEVPLAEGSAVVHHSRTLHSAGVNLSPLPRRAYILGYSVQTKPHSFFMRDYPWNVEKRTAREERALSHLPPFKRTLRRLRRLIRGG